MRARIFRLAEYLQRVEDRLEIEKRRKRPDPLTLLYLRTAQLRIRRALSRAIGRIVNPHRRARAMVVCKQLQYA
ncbi:hypothetical protein KUV75_12110 [Qipengyuania gaetbuli]|jgi:hypothetical protein|uniref:hypothetical protein n=1 Tax=Qipengyuania gaetbuli TaxID=266952 RepID=UPI001C995D7E|nr:hypothetical protein [Qipengyuania gaetbuli]MBY6015642.1 hypothetical protein [Qipengyuania gaetbuli]